MTAAPCQSLTTSWFFFFFLSPFAECSIDSPLEQRDAVCDFIHKLSFQLLVILNKAKESVAT